MRIRNWKCDLFNEGWNKNSRTISDFAAIYGPWTLDPLWRGFPFCVYSFFRVFGKNFLPLKFGFKGRILQL